MEYYKKGIIKHIPEFLLPRIKPNLIEDIMKNDNLLGKVAGINIKPIEFNDEKELERYIEAIREIKTEFYTNLYIEDYKLIPYEIIRYMEKSLNIRICKGNYIKLSQIPLILRKIYFFLKEDLGEKEVLILSDDKEVLKEIIKNISEDFKLITAIGCDNKYEDEVYEYILEETGLSLFYSSNINKILENYSIIINLMDDFNLDSSKIKRNCIVFDFSEKSLVKNKDYKSNRIEDFVFDLKTIGIDKIKWIESNIYSDLYESLNLNPKGKISYLSIGSDYYTVEEYVNLFIRQGGKL